ncbi:histidine triad protein [Entomoplasma ellychniae]|uniref:Histidine triad protein n=2 Tax=Entomoplasmataceae TaxID=33925 RepID=A0A2S5RGG0_9MOLU|nr:MULTISPECIES: HIT domain-containing protein [Entomoplasmataceae]PPE05042.1 histidine triad protein [Entomoplasma ellychniae]PPE06424.1 histidine triad protein [Mesoplasma corruscae]
MNNECLFCKILNKEIPSYHIYENEYVYAFLDAFPNADGHTLVIPKKHFKDFSSTDDLYIIEVAKAKKIVAKILMDKIKDIKGFNFVSNQEAIASQVIFHYHEHVVPKYIKEEGYLHNKNVILKHKVHDLHKILKDS